jgi:hypothetical protein
MELLGLKSHEEIQAIRNPLAAGSSPTDVNKKNLTDLVLDLFPRIPVSDMESIIEHAFEKVSTDISAICRDH